MPFYSISLNNGWIARGGDMLWCWAGMVDLMDGSKQCDKAQGRHQLDDFILFHQAKDV